MKYRKPLSSHRPLSIADIQRIKAEAKRQGVIEAFAIFFSALRDKEGFGPNRLRRVLDTMNNYADSIRNGYLTIQDLQDTLREETGIELCFNSSGTDGSRLASRPAAPCPEGRER